MKIVLSARVETDLANQLQYGIDHFGATVAERTFARVDNFLFGFLPAHPLAGKPTGYRHIYEVWITKTPFVIFYSANTEAGVVTVLALFHHAQDRSSFDPQE